MAAKKQAAPVRPDEVTAYLDVVHPLGWTCLLSLAPDGDTGYVYANVSVFGYSDAGRKVLMQREGERVSGSSPTSYLGAWLRAALRVHAKWEGVSLEDAKRLASWEEAAKRRP